MLLPGRLVLPGGLSTRISRGRASESPGPSRVTSRLATAALVCGALAAVAMLGPALLGYERYVITGDSMSGTYDRGSIVYSEVVPTEELSVGDVITYDPPGVTGGGGLVTHRIVSMAESPDGSPVVRTKGDANATRDPGMMRLGGAEQARAVASIPYVGFAFAALGVREVRMAVIGVPAALIALALIVGLWRDAGTEIRRETADERTAIEA